MNRDYQISLSARKLSYKIEQQLKEITNLHNRGINVLNKLTVLTADISFLRSLLLEISDSNPYINRSRLIYYRDLIEQYENLFLILHPQRETEFPEELLEVDIPPPKLPPSFEDDNNLNENVNINQDYDDDNHEVNQNVSYEPRAIRITKVVENMRLVMREMSRMISKMNDDFLFNIRNTRKEFNPDLDRVGLNVFVQRMRNVFNQDTLYQFFNLGDHRMNRSYTKLVSLLFKIYATQSVFWYYEVVDDNLILDIILKLLYFMMVIPLTESNYPAFVLEMEYLSLNQELTKKRKWFLHVQSISYLLYSLTKYFSNQYIVYEKEQESDPIAILTNIRRIRYVKLYPIQYNNEQFVIQPTRRFIDTLINGQLVSNYLGMRSVPVQQVKILEQLLNDQLRTLSMVVNNEIERLRDNEHRVGFFPYYHTTSCNLLRYQIAKDYTDYINHGDIFNENCLIYAMKLSNLFTENEIYEMSLVCYGRIFPLTKFYQITEQFNFKIELNKYYEQRYKKYTFGTSNERILKLVLIHGHILLDEKTTISRVQLGIATRNPNRYIKSSQLMKILIEKKLITPVKMCDVISLNMTLYKDIPIHEKDEYLGRLNYDEKLSLKEYSINGNNRISFQAKKSLKDVSNGDYLIFYADFETFTVDDNQEPLEKHIPFMCCITNDLVDVVDTFEGIDCGKYMLDYIYKHAYLTRKYPIVYFHNLGYDLHFLAKYGLSSSIDKGHRVLSAEITYKNIIITFKDSYSLIPTPLRAFDQLFGLKVEKELFPYKFYTENRYYSKGNNSGMNGNELITECIDMMKGEWTDEQCSEFWDNVQRIENTEDIPITFNLREYAKFYCEKDVEVLKAGLRMFKHSIFTEFNISIEDYLSISSLASGIFYETVYSKIPNLYLTGGIIREFMSRGIHGGRVMTNSNKKWHYKGKGLCDFDAVSLYPSAMKRLWIVNGKPQVFQIEELTADNILNNPKYTAYVVEIIITDIGIKRDFPLIPSYNIEKKHIEYTNEINRTAVVCDIELEDMVKFQKIKFTPIRGYYWTGEKIFTIGDAIQNIFDKRVQYKKEGNPIQNVYKLIMNSIYGKTIIKPHCYKYKYLDYHSEEYKNLYKKHNHDIIRMDQIDESDIVKCKLLTPIFKHYNFSIFGIHILAMSKRIMNEVMCLAEDLGIKIYYQDTDSMHIPKDDIPYLSYFYKQQYGRDLIGSNLGQFHSDFELLPTSKDVISKEAYFIGKKCYVDLLEDQDGNNGYHIRLKGIPNTSIKDVANKEYKGDVIALYKDLYEGKEITFDLLANYQIKFEYLHNMTIKNKTSFLRRVKF